MNLDGDKGSLQEVVGTIILGGVIVGSLYGLLLIASPTVRSLPWWAFGIAVGMGGAFTLYIRYVPWWASDFFGW